jgi:hypothetical protein
MLESFQAYYKRHLGYGNPVNIAAKKSTEVLRRQQADGTWRFVIDNPWGTD